MKRVRITHSLGQKTDDNAIGQTRPIYPKPRYDLGMIRRVLLRII